MSTNKFTLIELVVVIFICVVGIITIGATAGQVKISEDAVCKNNLKILGKYVALYANDNNDNMPAGFTPYPQRYIRWNFALTTYASDNPSSKLKELPQSIKNGCPLSDGDLSYGANYCYNNDTNAKLPFYYYDAEKPEISKISKYSELLPNIVMFAEASKNLAHNPKQKGCRPTRDISLNGIKDSASGSDYNLFAPLRHKNSMNYVACDGSVKSMKFDDFEYNMNNSGVFYNEDYNY